MNPESSPDHRPRLSIVTVHKDDWDGLQLTLASVEAARPSLPGGIQWIVIDGASTRPDPNGILPLIRAAADILISEPDNGIFDAMNKGTALATGNYLIFMNAGDILLHSGVLAIAKGKLIPEDGEIFLLDSQEGFIGGEVHTKRARRADFLWYGMPTHHQAVVFARRALPDLKYPLGFPIAGDYALLCELWAAGRKFCTVHETFCAFDLSGVSSRNYLRGLKEQDTIRATLLHLPYLQRRAIYVVRLLARAFRKLAPRAYTRARYTRS